MMTGAVTLGGRRRRHAARVANAAVLVLAMVTVPAAARLTTASLSARVPSRAHAPVRHRRGRRRRIPPVAPVGATAKPLRTSGAGPAAIGPLFYGGGGHHCTASVVSSPGGDLLVTAAHCIYGGGGYRNGVEFVPGYSGGSAPYGRWQAAAMFVDRQWATARADDDDVGFIVVRSRQGRTLERVTGANQLGVGYGPVNLVRVTGYPSTSDTPVTCSRTSTSWSTGQMRFDCDGFTGGTSGGPWVADGGKVVGVVGGYQRGGDTPAVSYSARFTNRVKALYDTAAAAR